MKDFSIPSWLEVLIILIVVAAIIGAIYAYGDEQFGLGQKAERAEWLSRENTELTEANALIVALEEAAREKERQHALAMAAVSAQYQEDLRDEKATRDRVVADLRSGAQRLRIELARRETAGGSGTAEGSASAGRCDGETHAELSVAASEFLVGLASEADEVVRQLTACQAVVTADRF